MQQVIILDKLAKTKIEEETNEKSDDKIICD